MLFEFHKLSLDDLSIFKKYANKGRNLNSFCDFSTIYNWNIKHNTLISDMGDGVAIHINYGGNKEYFAFPFLDNDEDIVDLVQDVDKYMQSKKWVITQLNENQANIINNSDCGYKAIYDRDFSEYIYDTQALTTLKGKKLHSKRNHLNDFLKSYTYEFRQYKPSDYEQVMELYDSWAKNSSTADDWELMALQHALRDYGELDLKIGVIIIDNRIQAIGVYSIAPFGVGHAHFEKCNYNYNGISVAINNFCVKEFMQETQFINRQEDMGLEGLRKAKLSYKPCILYNKYRIVKD